MHDFRFGLGHGLLLFLIPCALVTGIAGAADSPGPRAAWLGQRHCLADSGHALFSPPPRGWGKPSRLQVERGGQALLAGQDFAFAGDSALQLVEPLGRDDTLCLWTFESPAFPNLRWKSHDAKDIPALDSAGRMALLQSVSGPEALPEWMGVIAAPGWNAEQEDEYRLDFSGSKTMAVSVGDGGGLGLDATLLLDVKGQLARDVFIEGRLSDQNVPVQPEGNTATLKELDTKYVRLYGQGYEATLGDFQLQHGIEGIDRVEAKVAGVRGSFRKGGWDMRAALAQTQGIYRSDTLRGVDGKQAGYYLRARDGRIFVRVMPGTERLWRNGSPLERGLDYTIDYAEGRVDFLNRVSVSSENLFAAEYEYAEEDYPRSLASLSLTDTLGPWILGARVVRLREDAGNPLGAASDSSIKRALEAAGDASVRDTSGFEVRAPEAHIAGVLEAQWRPDSLHASRLSLALTQRDANLYSPRDDRDNQGAATHYQGRQGWGESLDKRGHGAFEARVYHDYRGADYAAFNPWIEPRAFRDLWNLDARTGERDFSANRLQLAYIPWSLLRIQGEAGLAEGLAFADSAASATGKSRARRLAIAGQAGQGPQGPLGLDISSEAKLAASPGRRDNYRQQGRLHFTSGGFRPEVSVDRNEWINELGGNNQSRTLQTQPGARLRWQAPFQPLSLETGLEQVIWQSQFDGRLIEVADSAHGISLEQRAVLSGWGPFSGEGFYRFQKHDVWSLDAGNQRSPDPRSDRYHLFESQMRWNQGNKGLSAATAYKAQRTSELPLIGDYRKVEVGQGQYVYDGKLNAYHESETEGDYVLVGLMRDTSLSTRPYQDVQWTADFEIIPARFPVAIRGLLADLEFSAQVAAELQDSSEKPLLFPLLDDAGIRAAQSGRTRYQPQIRWRHPGGDRQITVQAAREYAKTSGLYASLDRRFALDLIGRQTWSEIWDATLTLSLQNGERQARGNADGLSRQQGRGVEGRLQRQFAMGFLGLCGLAYRHVEGDATEPYNLLGWRPWTRLEKAIPGRGRAFVEYALQSWSGSGQGDYYALGGYAKGLTHRVESSADFELQTYLLMHAGYLIRFEPGRGRPSQRLDAEIRAVF